MTASFGGDRPLVVRHADATRSLWGDADSGQVADLLYGSGPRLSGVSLTLPPGRWFGASADWKPVPLNREHRVWYVVQGTLALHDPESGHVAVAGAGQAISWYGSQYHFAYNPGETATVVLDWWAPNERPPGLTDQEWASSKRTLGPVIGGRYDLLTGWPDRRAEHEAAQAAGAPVTVTIESALRLIEGARNPVLVSILASSPDLTCGTFALRGGAAGDVEHHPGDEVLFVTEGCLHVRFPALGAWLEVGQLDCLYVPAGVEHAYDNQGTEATRAVFGVAPRYR
jgi:mannose-6-phosphate isomerase-like protein (cupin superfamily)